MVPVGEVSYKTQRCAGHKVNKSVPFFPSSFSAGAYFSTTPFLGAAVALLIFGESVTVAFWIASALMAVGVWLHLTERHAHEHLHEATEHGHWHVHDEHHQHEHGFEWDSKVPHSHVHAHGVMRHSHAHFPDVHHRHRH